MNGIPLAYFLTFSTYASRLPGDDRGTVSAPRSSLKPKNLGDRPGLAVYSKRLARSAPVVLDGAMRRFVEAAITERCAAADWPVHALNVRTNHVHIVVTAENASPERVTSDLKSRATKRLRDQGVIGEEARVWSRHGSTRYVWNEAAMAEVVDYVLFQQGTALT